MNYSKEHFVDTLLWTLAVVGETLSLPENDTRIMPGTVVLLTPVTKHDPGMAPRALELTESFCKEKQ